jgi:hypothetical protein
VFAAICWSIWITRNKITFDGYKMKTPISLIFTMCSFLKYWSGLYKEEEKAATEAGAEQMVQVAVKLAGGELGRPPQDPVVPGVLMITNG